mmetsp:Transcript_24399/g.44128  ORF Transcript_24399/g.44128 Transcript_24399/m.44128 type:complete len:447 (-) Transcript_24399:45-1385(-)
MNENERNEYDVRAHQERDESNIVDAASQEEAPHARPQMTDDIKRLLQCPISHEIMKDPVTLVQSGHTFDREALCKWLSVNPTKCPFTNVDYREKLQYGDNVQTRKLLFVYLGDDAYQRYDDSAFKLWYAALWNEPLYKRLTAFLYGMNQEQINWTAAQQTGMNDHQNDPIVLGFKSLLLYSGLFPSNQLEKDDHASQVAWQKAEDIGLSILADGGNQWALWLKGMFADTCSIDREPKAAMQFFQLAADQGHALSQNSLGTLHVENEDYDEAEEYYQCAANQGHALAQYNTGMMYEPDFEMSRPHIERAAAQGHASALFSLGNLYANSDVSQDYEYARYYYREASRQGHALAESELARLQSRRNERHYYRLATEYGHNEAKSDLALLRTYKQREGMPRVTLAPNTVAHNHDNLQENKSDVVAENAAYYFNYFPISSSLERCVNMFDP